MHTDEDEAVARSRHQLRYDRPAESWTEALPLGNGALGIMAFGGTSLDHLQINDETAWSGSPRSNSVGGVVSPTAAASALGNARTAIGGGDFTGAAEELRRLQHRHSQSFLPFVDLMIETAADGDTTDYARVLDMELATHTVTYRQAGSLVSRETFVSAPDGVAVIRITSDRPGGMSLSLGLSTVHRTIADLCREDGHEAVVAFDLPESVAPPFDDVDAPIVYPATEGSSMPGVALVRWSHDGEPTSDGRMSATGVSEATVWVATATTFVGIGEQPHGTADDALHAAEHVVQAAHDSGFAVVRARQRADHAALYQRVDLEIDPGDPVTSQRREDDSLDIRLIAANDSGSHPLEHDPRLIELLFNFGRYLLISSSRPGGVPANLQGIWNDSVRPPWSSNYTTNINVEMNYWPAEVVGLGELTEPLFDLIDGLAQHGRETARRLYGAGGWVAHHNTDVGAYTHPVGWGRHDPRWAFWPMAGPWLVRHLWEHVQFGAGTDFAEARAWPAIRSAAEFCLDWLVELPDGSLGTSPSTSPENDFIAPDGTIGSVDVSSTLDLTLIADLFDMVGDLAGLLGLDDPIVVRARESRLRLPDPSPGADGLIREWIADRPQNELDHRHISHLYFVYPGARVLTPELTAAAGASLDARGGESTGWSIAWKVAVEARLRRREKVGALLALAFRDMRVDRGEWAGGLYPNFFAAHPPFQIDANFGLVAGIVECLLQSHHGHLELLPSVPREMGAGRVRGLVARPGISVDLRWRWVDGQAQLEEATFLARTVAGVGAHRVVFGSAEWRIDLALGVAYTLRPEASPAQPAPASLS